ncbi:MAG TPA: hypothetical protein VGR61_07825 [Candidatus Dormibacteraeota bacterium]|nr:hypothetical protein [Candidatus Dormibacteraeota bacterium]
MMVVAHNVPFLILGGMLFFEAFLYFSAPWAAAAAEGIALTPFREIQRRSAQNTGARPSFARRAAAVPTGAAIGVGAVLAAGLLVASPAPGINVPSGPSFGSGQAAPDFIQKVLGTGSSPTPSAGASPTGTPSSTPLATPSVRTTPVPSASAAPSASGPPSPGASPSP